MEMATPPAELWLSSRALEYMIKIEKARWQYWFYASWFKITVRYRKTILGPLWLIAGPAVMVSMLGFLFATIANLDIRVFIPHLALGIVIWSLIGSFVNNGTTVIFHNRPKIIHSAMKLIDVVMVNIFTALLQFLHHIVIIIVTYFIFPWDITSYAFVSLIGLALLIINGVWYAIVFGILGVRFRDISEVVSTIMGAMFFVTPILWMAGTNGRGGLLGPYLTYNPFYHFMELIRAPILGTPIDPLSWIVVLAITVIGIIAAVIFDRKFAKLLPTWF